jgi:phospholipid/cholesterol/gamma-HCH transport system permease protein
MALDADNQNGKAGLQLGRLLTGPFAVIGRAAIRWVDHLGASGIFLLLAFLKIVRSKQLIKIVQQLYYIGARSMMIIMLVSFFTGMVLGLQSYHALVKFGAQGALGTLVALTLVRELGPVLTAIMIAARAGSAITAEIGIQRISEQIDALDTMRIDPISHQPQNYRCDHQLSLAHRPVRPRRHYRRVRLRRFALGRQCQHLCLPCSDQYGPERYH